MVKSLPANAGDVVHSLGWEDLSQKEMDNPLQYSCLENSMDRRTWWAME